MEKAHFHTTFKQPKKYRVITAMWWRHKARRCARFCRTSRAFRSGLEEAAGREEGR